MSDRLLSCYNTNCRVNEYFRMDMQDREETAWSHLDSNQCPGCSEVGE